MAKLLFASLMFISSFASASAIDDVVKSKYTDVKTFNDVTIGGTPIMGPPGWVCLFLGFKILLGHQRGTLYAKSQCAALQYYGDDKFSFEHYTSGNYDDVDRVIKSVTCAR